MVVVRGSCQGPHGFSVGVSTGKTRVGSEPCTGPSGGVPDPLGKAHDQCVFILQGVWESNADVVMKLAEKTEQTLGDVSGAQNTCPRV